MERKKPNVLRGSESKIWNKLKSNCFFFLSRLNTQYNCVFIIAFYLFKLYLSICSWFFSVIQSLLRDLESFFALSCTISFSFSRALSFSLFLLFFFLFFSLYLFFSLPLSSSLFLSFSLSSSLPLFSSLSLPLPFFSLFLVISSTVCSFPMPGSEELLSYLLVSLSH